jgi:hypothetical protein
MPGLQRPTGEATLTTALAMVGQYLVRALVVGSRSATNAAAMTCNRGGILIASR